MRGTVTTNYLGKGVMFKLSFLGTFQVYRNDILLTQFRSNKVRALLTYLAVEQTQPHERAALAGLFWPEMPEAKALNNLSKTLGFLRKMSNETTAVSTPPPLLLTTRKTIQWNPDNTAHVDVPTFKHLLADNSDSNNLEHAVNLYQGPFLDGFYLPGCPCLKNGCY